VKTDADFEASFQQSKRAARDYLKNVDYYQSSIYGAVSRYDSKLLMRLLRRTMPEKFGVRR
jgi:hypothetical protein